MSESAVELEVVTIDERAERILKYHDLQRDAFGQQMGYIFLAGYELNQAKDELPHGEYEKWRERTLPTLPKSTSAIYRGFAEGLISKCPTVGHLTGTLQLTQGSLSPEARQTVIEAVHLAADGKSLMEMYRELDLVRKPKKPTFTPPKKLSAKEQVEAEKKAAMEEAKLIVTRTLQFIGAEDGAVLLGDVERKELLEGLMECTSALREMGQGELTAKSAKTAKKTKK